MRNPTLHELLEAFTTDAALKLSLAALDGASVPFEVVESPGSSRRGGAPLYCYRPLTVDFIRARLGLLAALPTYAPAVRALEAVPGLEAYLARCGETRHPERPRDRADAAMRCFLARCYEERNQFDFDADRFATAYDELERSLYQGHSVVEVVTPLLGLALDPETAELALGDGVSIVRRDTLTAPPEDPLVNPADQPDPDLLLVLRRAQDRSERAPVWLARNRFQRVLTALRLFERGGCALGPLGFARVDDGPWRPASLGSHGRPGETIQISIAQEDELRAFVSLIGRRLPAAAPETSGAGELAWALSRFEMGCDKLSPLDTLTDHLLALRALLEPEGPASGRLAQRLAVICARPEDRAGLAERAARAISLERAVIAGLAEPPADSVVDEVSECLRAILRDVLCGHLDADVCAVADELLEEAAGAAAV